jgi:hypothetical protein
MGETPRLQAKPSGGLRYDGRRCANCGEPPTRFIACTNSSAVTMSLIARTSGGDSRWGDVCGRDDRSSSAHACCRRRQAWRIDSGTIAGTAGRPQRHKRTGTIHGSQDPDLGASVGQRSCVNVNPELRRRARASRRSAVSFFTRRRSSRTSCWSSDSLKSVTSRRVCAGSAGPPGRWDLLVVGGLVDQRRPADVAAEVDDRAALAGWSSRGG